MFLTVFLEYVLMITQFIPKSTLHIFKDQHRKKYVYLMRYTKQQ